MEDDDGGIVTGTINLTVRAVPRIDSITRDAPSEAFTSADTLVFRVKFNTAVENVGKEDFILRTTSTATIAKVEAVEGEGDTIYLVTIAGGDLATFNGTLGLDLAATQNVSDPYGEALRSTKPTIRETYVVDNLAPKPGAVVIGDESGQRSVIRTITVNFDSPIVFDSGAFELRHSDGTLVPVTADVAPGKATTKVVLTLATLPGESLGDGNYRLTVLDSLVRDLASNGFDGDQDGMAGGHAVDEFFRLFGDSDGDRDVDGQDYGRFGMAFLKSAGDPGYNPAMDADGDGDVDGQDYGQFGQRFLKRLEP